LALSDAAFDLGVIALEANAGAPAGGAAILADLQGTLDAVERGAAALASAPAARELAAVRAEIAPLRARLSGITSSNELLDRASFVMGTARLGVAVRSLAGALGASPKLPYRARVPVAGNTASEPVSVLTVPAPRLPAPGSAPGREAPDLADLGQRLFHDKRLSRGDVRSCATCHDPARGFADGLPTPRSLDPAVTLRHTPTLLYAPLHAAQMWDGRTLTPEQQALNVIHARAEMGLTAQELVEKLAALPAYRGAIDPDPGGDGASTVARALVAFENERLVPADAPIDRFARGEEGALSPDERAGLDVFAGAGRCTRCHVPPLFGGSRPRDFAVPVFAVLGVPADAKGKALDADRGRGAVTGRPADERSFKTPTARDVARTAPYFHHGRFATLEEVVDFYNRGGGRGLGLTVENQDPDVRPLKLTPEQTRVALVFMRTGLLDASLAEAPPGLIPGRAR
jgi:cytochrome c peroxidase